VERDLIRTRTAEGRSRAQKRGQHMGRPSKPTEAQKAEARRRREQGATLAEPRAQLRCRKEHDFATVTSQPVSSFIHPQASHLGRIGTPGSPAHSPMRYEPQASHRSGMPC
jgi:hypothetical protein